MWRRLEGKVRVVAEADSPWQHMRDRIETAITAVVQQVRTEHEVLLSGTERCMVARLLAPLEQALRVATDSGDDFYLDMEYERFGAASKSFNGYGPAGFFQAKIVPDMIFHRRGAGENILAIEVKLTGSAKAQRDQDKLGLLTGDIDFVRWKGPPADSARRIPGKLQPSERQLTWSEEPPTSEDFVWLADGFTRYRYGVLLRLSPGPRHQLITWFGRDPASLVGRAQPEPRQPGSLR